MLGRTHDPIYRAKINLVEVGGKTMPFQAPVVAWAVGGFIAFPIFAVIAKTLLGGWSLVSIFLSVVAAGFVGKWVARETGGDHRLRDVAMTIASETRSAARHYQTRRAPAVTRHTLRRSR